MIAVHHSKMTPFDRFGKSGPASDPEGRIPPEIGIPFPLPLVFPYKYRGKKRTHSKSGPTHFPE